LDQQKQYIELRLKPQERKGALVYSIRYHFSQIFNVPPFEAYRWCTSYDPNDLMLMHQKGKREITYLTESTLILSDTFYGEKETVKKNKLIQLYPDRLLWINTHLSGPNKYSQFLYEIKPEDEGLSKLNYSGLQIDYKTNVKRGKKEIEKRETEQMNQDVAVWKIIAKEMEKELGKTI
jgi:hypothetical protein